MLRTLLAFHHNATRVPQGFYERRIAEKRWVDRWPKLRIVAPAGPSPE